MRKYLLPIITIAIISTFFTYQKVTTGAYFPFPVIDEDTASANADDGFAPLSVYTNIATSTSVSAVGDYGVLKSNLFGWLNVTDYAATTTTMMPGLDTKYLIASGASTSQDVAVGGFRRCALSFTIQSTGTGGHGFQIEVQAKVGANYFTVRNNFLQRWTYEDTGTATAQNEYIHFPNGCPEAGTLRIQMSCNASCTAVGPLAFTISNTALHMTN